MRTSILFLCFLLSCNLYGQDTFNTSGTWVCPAGVTSVSVECWGGGGGGGYAVGSGGGSHSVGTGGGGGCYSQKTFTVIPGNSYIVTVGSGGAGGNATTIDGQSGGDSWFISATNILAKGAGGGTGNNPTTAGTVVGYGTVSGSIGDVIYLGGNGGNGRIGGLGTIRVYGGGGGGSAGNMGNGNNGSQFFGGFGGDDFGGAGGNGYGGYGSGGAAGFDGIAPGGGGGGAGVFNTEPPTTNFNGGNGGNGMIIISEAAPLPVHLVYFKGSCTKDASILFKWKVASQNTKSVTYSIEGSCNGDKFIEVYSHKYHGKIPSEYSYTYHSLNKSEIFYRLKSEDETGAVKYSNVIQVNSNNNNTGISFYPNPSKGVSFIDYVAPAKDNISVSIYDMNGKKVFFRQYAIDAGLNQLPVNITTLREGVYTVEMFDYNGKPLFAAKLIKQ